MTATYIPVIVDLVDKIISEGEEEAEGEVGTVIYPR